jgi:glucose/arabinose dehydrogenase
LWLKGLEILRDWPDLNLKTENIVGFLPSMALWGGDEINLVEKGHDYGWLKESYGTAYAPGQSYSKTKVEGFQTNGTLPIFSWVPSIATWDLVQVSGSKFSYWWGVSRNGPGDILVASLKDKSIHRL